MNRLKPIILTLLLILLALIFATPARADGIIVPEPPICDPGPCPPRPFPISQLAIEYHRVRVTIEDQVAVTQVDQVFRNDNEWVVEGTYIFPLPVEAAVTNFTLWVDGEPVEGKVLSRDEARRKYEEIVRSLRDPALLEYVDRGAVQASIFPIQPGEKRRIELEYTQALAADNGLIHFRYPLNTEKFSTQPLEDVSVSVKVESSAPVRAVYSPSHNVAIDRDGDHRFSASYEDSDVTPDKDFDLFYSIANEEVGLNLISYRDPQDEDDDGFFLLMVAPRVEVDPNETITKDVLIVIDRSGSMEGEKFRQAQDALHYILDHLNEGDRFNIIAFSSGTRAYAERLRPADEAEEAHRWVDSLSAAGATDVNLALLEAIEQANDERPTLLIFLTDGLPTEGETDTGDILKNIERAAPSNLSLFAFGVGYDVDTFLLDTLAKENHGATTYVTPGQKIDEAVSGFYAKVSTPVLTDLELDYDDVIVFDTYPDPLPDLFAGSQLLLVGRYKEPGTVSIRLSGTVDGETQRFTYEDQTFRSSGGPDFLPRLWATRKIGALLNQIRLEGPEEELVEQVVRLSVRYGIVTEYTSYLVTEPNALGFRAQEEIAEEAFADLAGAPMESTGQGAVERAERESRYMKADVAVAPSGEAAEVVRIAGARTFRLVDEVWVDTAYDPETMEPLAVPFLSEDYFTLANARPDLAAALALGSQVIILVNDTAYQVVDEDARGDPITIPPTLAPDEVPAPAATDRGSAQTDQRSSPSPLPCPGIGLALGLTLAALPIRRRGGFTKRR